MQINPAALTTTDAVTVTAPTKPLSVAPPAGSQKITKALISVPRLDIEPIYTELKITVGPNWAEYKQATTLFLLGHLNQNEFTARINPFITLDPKLEHLHNNFVCAILGNLSRDLPDHGVASWVSANDKPTLVSKPASGDAAEQRLKTEVMQLPPRDRRRLKSIPEPDPHTIPSPYEEYQLAKQIRIPDQAPASAGGLTKTNWELEIRKRYAQPLASETGEFPDAESIHSRMTPICYEESLSNGPSASCAQFMAVATENFVKTFLSNVFGRTRSNGPSGTINGTMTRKYRLQLEKEEMAFTRGELLRSTTNGLLPVEAKEASTRKALGLRDLQLTLDIGPAVLGHMPLVIHQVMNGYLEEELEDERKPSLLGALGATEKTEQAPSGDEMDIDDDDSWEWEGATAGDHNQLCSILDECLSIAV
ncbi:transcriptional coactivator hfi1/ADA1 [Myotisia sp. PD_48]|nr:transcriptional coactivator hfi1/ADA1 [Myotisia sp. PD_48]